MRKTILFILLAISSIAIAQTRLTPLSRSVKDVLGSSYINEDAECMMMVHPDIYTSSDVLYIGLKRSSKEMYKLVVKDMKKVTHKMNSDSLTITRLSDLVKHAVNTASYTYNNTGNGGIYYYFFDRYHVAYVWSPRQNSNTDVLVETLSGVMEAVKKKNQKDIDALMPRVDSLTHIFKSLYPEEIFTFHKIQRYMPWRSSKNIPEKPYVVLMTGMMRVDFVIPQSWYEEKSPEKANKYAEKYASMVKAVGRYLFVNTTLLDDSDIDIIIDDSLPRSIESGKKFILHEEDLTEEKLKNIITTRTLP